MSPDLWSRSSSRVEPVTTADSVELHAVTERLGSLCMEIKIFKIKSYFIVPHLFPFFSFSSASFPARQLPPQRWRPASRWLRTLLLYFLKENASLFKSQSEQTLTSTRSELHLSVRQFRGRFTLLFLFSQRLSKWSRKSFPFSFRFL